MQVVAERLSKLHMQLYKTVLILSYESLSFKDKEYLMGQIMLPLTESQLQSYCVC